MGGGVGGTSLWEEGLAICDCRRLVVAAMAAWVVGERWGEAACNSPGREELELAS